MAGSAYRIGGYSDMPDIFTFVYLLISFKTCALKAQTHRWIYEYIRRLPHCYLSNVGIHVLNKIIINIFFLKFFIQPLLLLIESSLNMKETTSGNEY